MIHGADYSNNNSSISTAGLDFVFLKATEGTSTIDETFAKRYASLEKLTLARGAYHFGWENESYSAQASHFVNTVKPIAGDILFLDFESYPDKRNWGKMSWTELAAWVMNFIKEVKKLVPSCKVGLYCNLSDWNSLPGTYCGDFLFIADYTNSRPSTKPAFTFWQYTDSPHDLDWGNFSNLDDLSDWSGKVSLTAADVWNAPVPENVPGTPPVHMARTYLVDNYQRLITMQSDLDELKTQITGLASIVNQLVNTVNEKLAEK